MFIFFIFFVFILFVFKESGYSVRKKYVDFCVLLILIFLASFSYTNGWDYYNYKGFFDFVITDGIHGFFVLYKSGIEIGYLAFIYILSFFSDNYQLCVFFQGIIINVIFFRAVKKFSINYTLFALLFLSSFFMKFELSTIRQGIAVAFCFYALSYFYTENIKKFYLWVFVGFLFHYSAIVVFIFPVFYKFFSNKNYKFYFVIGVLAIPIYYFTVYFRADFFNLLQGLSYNNIFFTKLIAYSDKYNDLSLPLIQVYSLFLYIIFSLFFYNKNNKMHVFVITMYTLLIIIQFYIKFLPSLLAVRLEYYFIISQLLFFILLYGNENRLINLNKSLFVFLLIFFVIMNYGFNIRVPSDRAVYFPYYSYYEHIFFNVEGRSVSEIINYSLGRD